MATRYRNVAVVGDTDLGVAILREQQHYHSLSSGTVPKLLAVVLHMN
jgi:hypothetical protein